MGMADQNYGIGMIFNFMSSWSRINEVIEVSCVLISDYNDSYRIYFQT